MSAPIATVKTRLAAISIFARAGWPAVESGKLKLPIDKVYPFGKIVVTQ